MIRDECPAVMCLLSSPGVWFILKNFAVKDTKKLGKRAGFERREAKLFKYNSLIYFILALFLPKFFSSLLTFSDLINIFTKKSK